jgi:hypothetical protein
VPVSSKTIASIEAVASSAAPPLINIPRRAARAIVALTAVGDANPGAHGQAMTRIVTLRKTLPVTASTPPAKRNGSGAN